MSNSALNRRWAELLLEALTRHGLRHVCIAPGSRSTSLTLAAAENHKLICHTHFDERGLGYLALGLAKAGKEPIAVIVTSGTAVANLYPSLIEAGLTGERLVFLTADRPPELIDCGANQAIRQVGIFASHPAQTLALPRPTTEIPASWLVSSIDNAMSNLKHGALHINCPFAEPLYGNEMTAHQDWLQTLGTWWQGHEPWLAEPEVHTTLKAVDWDIWQKKRGIVLAGRMSAEEGKYVAQWAKEMGWPLIGDVLSQTGQPLPCTDLWLTHSRTQEILAQGQLVIQFGASLTGKRLLQWQAKCQPEQYWIVDPIAGRLDPANHRGRKFTCSVTDWLREHPAYSRAPWAEELNLWSKSAFKCVETKLTGEFSEAAVAHQLHQLLPEQGQLFVGNSLVVRLVDALGQLPVGYPVYSNRGASGIDGLIATAAGVQRATNKPTLTIIGDISALYDLNSLALLRHLSAPMLLIIVNNNGGQIFSLLPTPQEERQRFYCMPQDVNFDHVAAMFGLNYAAPQNWPELKRCAQQVWDRKETTLIELKVSGNAGAICLQELLEQVAAL
ncbi:2-succinyl-5-enolpyruvyl-6-hydroxy-3-cyclohexene-1-carboxylic-acid synthase [Xenorhabdus griffiniae]|uniref:2-succinyl-5-enolpyruvyl-6-hydroxy-3-cyclohexene-1-carboxylate synthase n=1 Tax=Xenorhabdus griffiniae TaxID=351672 RepID=A0ABY9XLJ4_9GAMM|nr:2-succinyl-5-enolpyruvyl-6-hydroxy-3-cyclohexene-1-carboxylic-acid synthase [Xenorhabdus griffiniae]MBD1226212.1 2-succinyl-5-enolpyruvyl-6-hydroxy-3-cyclohexene-1-carboxylic-acid synthase [Xenorhabdus griffiniae]MBE8586442.1 2-succinyl-5-enolpyruvyl-6-hydroxy-3-cyclohexene-1-carboxylic-acid synthase [Xenorhabdus griffiniae]WMV73807.1 2-succinyl-5-enolpyruvyl-6-hydroxy-3-cyclohexene-1-carboxylic-acid synthase [Xenorhabdus griffiniae]WNH03488.1 2-succinyl-5-enolpyruvyl-6-hydroxy-3-cyclohexene